MQKLIIVIPTYNEADNLPALASQLWALPIPDLSLLVVDDGSPDGTGEVAENLAAHNAGRIEVIHRNGKLGLGTAYITGFKHALASGAQAVGQMDADFSHSPQYLPDFMHLLESGDAVLGSRYVEGGSLDERWGIGRVLLSWFGNAYARTILGLKILDATGGFRLWRRDTLLGMPLDSIRSNGYAFQIETNFIAWKKGFRIKEMPIVFVDRRVGASKMNKKIV